MMSRVFLASIPLILFAGSAQAQSWRWYDSGDTYYERRSRSYYYRPYYAAPPPPARYRALPPSRYVRRYDPGTSFLSPDDRRWGDRYDETMPRIMSGGPRPSIEPIPPRQIAYTSRHPVGTIIIDTAGRQLLLIQSDSTALRYPISVGREGFAWTGEEKISRVADWPDWHPPAEMRDRDPRLPEKMTGGIKNPLGAKALYLGKTLYRIHGTNDAKSIGRAQSSGCFRMLNGHVLDLAGRVGVGTQVIVSRNLRSAEAAKGRQG